MVRVGHRGTCFTDVPACPSKLLPGAALGRPTLGGDRASRHDLDMEEIVKMC